MTEVQDILFDVTGQFLIWDCQEGRPSSVTSVEVFRVEVGDAGPAELATSGVAAVETNPSTTVDAASGVGQADPRIVNIAATTGAAVGRRFLLTAADAYREWVEVVEVDAGVSVTARHPLHRAYAAADTFQSTRISIAVDATWVADEANLSGPSVDSLNMGRSRGDSPNPCYRVRWVYVVAGVTYVQDGYFDVVRYRGEHGVQPQDIEVLVPGWLDSLPTDYRSDQGRPLIDQAYDEVRMDLHQVWIPDQAVANPKVIDSLVRLKVFELGEYGRWLRGGAPDERRYVVARGRYTERFDSLFRVTSKTPVANSTGAATVRPPLQITRR